MAQEHMTIRRRWQMLGVLGLAGLLSLSGCDTVGYYFQAFRGQSELWQSTRPIGEVIADPQASEALRERLERVARIREFASQDLALPDNGSYRGYADLNRPYVVWNVFAAEPLSIAPKQWCFPVAGCVAYKGFFSETEAQALADELRRAGQDVFVSGVPAYSTLGYFDDPVLNTFIHYPPAELARLIFHELAHQVAYVRDDTVFNESFAVAVEREGVRRWMERHGTAAELDAFHTSQERRSAFYAIAGKYRSKLAQLYASGGSQEQMLAGKKVVFAELAAEYAALKASWGGFKGYDLWLGPEANNATLASIAVYTHQVPAFQALLDSVGNDLPLFYVRVKQLSALPKGERDARLAEVRDKTAAPGGRTAARDGGT
jgi:predicted aminopeptidase